MADRQSRAPREPARVLAVVPVLSGGVATSGHGTPPTARRHIVDPANGRPAGARLRSGHGSPISSGLRRGGGADELRPVAKGTSEGAVSTRGRRPGARMPQRFTRMDGIRSRPRDVEIEPLPRRHCAPRVGTRKERK